MRPDHLPTPAVPDDDATADTSSAFTTEQSERAYPDGVEHHWWSLARGHLVARWVRRHAGPGAVALDVGCGRGVAVRQLRHEGVDCWGVDLAPLRPLRDVAPWVRVGLAAKDLPQRERERYTVILLLDLIEHIADPGAFMRSLVRDFPRVTHVVVTVPARPELYCDFDRYYGHHRRYTLEMMSDLATELGWALQHPRHFFHAAFPFAWAVIRARGSRSTRFRAPARLFHVLHRLIAWLMRLEARLVPARWYGASIIACFTIGDSRR